LRGEAQRTSLARAFVVAPEVLFLDEAFAALDAPTREALLLDVETILRESNVTAVFATHERAEALMLADRVAVMLDGRIAQLDAPARVFGAPVTEAVARFVGFENILPGRVLASGVGMIDVEVGGTLMRVSGTANATETGVICIRAEDIRISRPGSVHLVSDRATLLSGTVKRIAPIGGGIRVHVDLGFEVRVLVSRHLMESAALAEGAVLHATIPASSAHFIAASEPARPLASSSVA
jgi:tungstate transport system ATP-binding protein